MPRGQARDIVELAHGGLMGVIPTSRAGRVVLHADTGKSGHEQPCA